MYQVEFDKTKRLFGEYEKTIGIAVEFDKNSNFIEAINFYKKSLEISGKLLALPHNHYSKATEEKNQSVQKRIIELMILQQQQNPNQNQQENAQNPSIALNSQQNDSMQYIDQLNADLNNEFQHKIYLNLQKCDLQNQQMPYKNPPQKTISNANQQQLVNENQKNDTPNQQVNIETPPKTDIHYNYQYQVPYSASSNGNSCQTQQFQYDNPPKTEIPIQVQQKPIYNPSKNENQIQYLQNPYNRYQQNPIENPPNPEIPKQNQPKPVKSIYKPENSNQSQPKPVKATLKPENTNQNQQKPIKTTLKPENTNQNQLKPAKTTPNPENTKQNQTKPVKSTHKPENTNQNKPKPVNTTPKSENTNQNQQDILINLPNQETPLQNQQKPQKTLPKNENQQRPFKRAIKHGNKKKGRSPSTNSIPKKKRIDSDLIRKNKDTQDQMNDENTQNGKSNMQDQISSENTQSNKIKSRIKNYNSYLGKSENTSSQKSKLQRIVESDVSSFIKPPESDNESRTSTKEVSTEISESMSTNKNHNGQITSQISKIKNRKRSNSTKSHRKVNRLESPYSKQEEQQQQLKKIYTPPLLSNIIEQYESFSIDSFLGKGSFGSVYLVTKKKDGTKYALKKIENPIVSDLTEKQLIREIELMNIANHPLVCHLRGFSFISELNNRRHPFIVTDYYPNGSLDKVVSGFKKFTPTQKLIALYGVANAMSYLHSIGIVHRDLKPENILLDEDDHPIVCDFGLSKLMEDSKARQTSAAGSPVYMAPELIWRQDYTNSIDVYAYAYICYELLTETMAFNDVESIPELVNLVCIKHKRPPLDGFDEGALPLAFKKFISLCWNDEPTKRPSFKEIGNLFVERKLRISGVNENQFNDFVNSIPRY